MTTSHSGTTSCIGSVAPTWTVGDVCVHRIEELALPPATGQWLLPDATPEVVSAHPWLTPAYAGRHGELRLVSQTFGLVVDGLRILVDTGIGNGKQRANPAWHNLNTDYLERLGVAGFAPDQVDIVVLTHLHADHVGWNTVLVDGTWRPTFTRARHVVARSERDFWASYDMEPPRAQMFRDSVVPVEAAGLLDQVEVPTAGVEIASGVRLIPTPGHTPGHAAVAIDRNGATALITGDCLHHPVQMPRPDLTSCVDIDPEASRATRRRLLGELVDTDTLLLGTHFPAPTGGQVHRDASGAYRLRQRGSS